MALVSAALLPFGVGALVYATLRSAATTLARGCVEGRDTFYPLDFLKNVP